MSKESNPSSAQEKREAARQAARAASQKDKKKAAGRKMLIQGSVAATSVAAIVGIGFLISSIDVPTSGPVAGPVNMISGGVVFEEGMTIRETGSYRSDETPVATESVASNIPHVVIYLDYSCPACKGFEEFYGEFLTDRTSSGEITLEYQIIAFRDDSTAGTRYSSRAANAAVCVADQAPEAFHTYHETLFANQPDMMSAAELRDSELIDLAVAAGVEDRDNISECIRDETFTPWVESNTMRAFDDTPLPVANAAATTIMGTPTTFINGVEFNGVSMEDLAAAITAAQE